MGRKKKTEQQADVTLIAKDSSVVKYTGTVTVQLVKNGRIVKSGKGHNEGKSELFKFLANCIAGNYVYNDCPTYLSCYNKNITNNNYTAQVTSCIPKAAISVEGSVTTIKFIVPRSALVSDATTITHLMLFNANKVSSFETNPENNCSAEIALTVPIVTANLSIDTNIIVLWKMTFEQPTQSV